ncbi:MAG: DUF885 domain-containing protein [Myxococcales bacterium]|nr:DUF885 domain-containing protein [Myxococcales bacterium]
MSVRAHSVAFSLLFASACASRPPPPKPPPPPPQATAAPVETPAPAKERDDDAIDAAGKKYVDLLVEVFPERGTELGRHERDSVLDDRTLVGEDRAIGRLEAMLAELDEQLAEPKASPAQLTDLAMIRGALRVEIRTRRAQRPLQRQPDFYVSGPLGAIFLMTAREYAPEADRARNVLSRLEQIPKTLEAAKANLLNPPKVWTEVGIDSAASAKGFLAAQKPFLEKALPTERARTNRALSQAVAAFDDYEAYLRKVLLKRSNGNFAAGKELFAYRLANAYFVEEDADALLALGKKIYERTQAEMTEVAKRIDPSAKGWPEVVAKLKDDHPSASGLLDVYKKEVARARAFLVEKDVVEMPPGDDLTVMETPPFMRSTLGSAAYDRPPPFDAGTKGFFFVTPVDGSLSKARQEEMLREHDHGDIVDTTVHEAYPGHHLQLSFGRRHPSLVRKALHPAIFSEGWALYSEELMAELGYYTDKERLMQLEWTLVRAARVILDVGLHTGTTTFEQAVKMLTDEVHLERTLATSEARRYTMTPTQPLSYLVGRERLFALREAVKKRDGDAFSLRRFHTDVLSRGSVPPSLLSREMLGAAR